MDKRFLVVLLVGVLGFAITLAVMVGTRLASMQALTIALGVAVGIIVGVPVGAASALIIIRVAPPRQVVSPPPVQPTAPPVQPVARQQVSPNSFVLTPTERKYTVVGGADLLEENTTSDSDAAPR
jgi:hypothetical protein